MEIISAWLIDHKASLEELSPMNDDGSEYMIGTAVVPATSMQQALVLFESYLEEQKMGLLELSKCEQFDPVHFDATSEKGQQVMHAAPKVLEDQKIRHFGVSSESTL
ncbi:hypothetical protein QWY82_10955 [Simiduia curdlanivorans]|uniref:Uncharacterized protein n=1 Tax=Simiduia curdlanivorans TaxID=1492769 RepID=A0ABV8VAT2_9GAMM|nr:hypothetical protein [Simiduia curdlanivorans]MDN3639322.1 hypothetical protein [Simiduia curdlanivorans]